MRVIPAAVLPAGLRVAETATPLALDEAEFRAFHERTARSLAAYLRRSLPADDVDDAVQEAYLRLLRTPHASLPLDERRAYLYRIAANLVNDAWRARKKTPVAEGAEPDTLAGRSPSETGRIDVTRAMGRLRVQEQTMLWLAYVEQASHREIASALSIKACATCREVEAVTQVLRAAVYDEPVANGTSAEDIWWRAQLQARQDARATAMRPVDTLERAEPLMVLVAVATLLVLRGDALVARVMAWATSDATGQTVQALVPPALLPVLMVGALLGGLVLIVGLGAVVAND